MPFAWAHGRTTGPIYYFMSPFAFTSSCRTSPPTLGACSSSGSFLLRSFKAPKSVTNTFASIRGFHLDRGLAISAFDSRQVSLFCRSLQHTLRHVPAHAPPLPFTTLERLCVSARSRGPRGTVFATLLSVTFFSMTRLSSLPPPPPTHQPYDFTRFPSFADLTVEGDHVWLKIKWAKCHQSAAQGFSVPLKALGPSPACPVALLNSLAAQLRGQPASTCELHCHAQPP